ncbi:methyltransferase-like protein 27 [Palaemon carinicauda]|uniref:methyltransferase-like protein 27 n=1 Tax=Palaemon carinicauda TaxID=392227 RepID=UPI0035B5E7C2
MESDKEKVADLAEKTAQMSEADRLAYIKNYDFFEAGRSHSQVIKDYAEWAKTYDNTLTQGNYNAPVLAADEAALRVPQDSRQSVRVLDVAAGTGRVGLELRSRGFKLLDALDACEGMLEILKGKGIYSKTYLESLGGGSSSVPGGTYDIVLVAGGMLEGHIPVKGVDDMIRFAKPGGLVIIVMREEYLHEVQEYRDRLVPHMESLQKEGKWTKVEVKKVPDYFFGKEGIIFTYKVL